MLLTRDPLSERVHLTKSQMLLTGLSGAAFAMTRRLFGRRAPSSAFGW
jgi:hypothetical protein